MKNNEAFSLLELSIVLVIIGLIAGGITAGSSMIRAAELRAQVTEAEQYKTAVYTFKDKYLGIPGDLKNATDFWGEIHATHATCIVTASPDNTLTCNGDGDGYVNETTFYATQGYERYHFWLHLTNADLIKGTFNGMSGVTTDFDDVPDVNSPSSKLSGTYWHIATMNQDMTTAGNANWFPRSYNYKFHLVVRSESSKSLTPAEMWSMDKKMDDGMAATGNVTTYKNSGDWEPGCATSDTMTAEYDLTNDDKLCHFRVGF